MKWENNLTVVLVVASLIFCLNSISFADVPTKILYQGVLKDSSGTSLDGDFDMIFSFYNTPSGVTPFWSESYTVVVTKCFLFVRFSFEIAYII